jgi:hypothetical protein
MIVGTYIMANPIIRDNIITIVFANPDIQRL